MGANSAAKKVDADTLKWIVFLWFVANIPQKVIARRWKLSERTVRNYIRDIELQLRDAGGYTWEIIAVRGLIGKSVRVCERYLDGDGEKVGGDLETAFRILGSIDVLKSPAAKEPRGDLTINQTQTHLTAINCPIDVHPREDSEFVDGLPAELERMDRAIKQLASGQMARRSGK